MPSGAQFSAIIDKEDKEDCANTQDYTTNTCRNVVTLNEILNGAFAGDMKDYMPAWGADKKESSAMVREYCLRNAMGIPLDGSVTNDTWNIRDWKKDVSAE